MRKSILLLIALAFAIVSLILTAVGVVSDYNKSKPNPCIQVKASLCDAPPAESAGLYRNVKLVERVPPHSDPVVAEPFFLGGARHNLDGRGISFLDFHRD